MEEIIITGATGFLGSHLAARFLERGDKVWALVRPGSPRLGALPSHENLRVIPCDLEHTGDCVERIGRGDAWFHFAWGGVNREEIDSPEVQKKNIRDSLACVEAARRLGCKVFTDAGSRVEYGPAGPVMNEDMECRPVNEYGKAKLEFFQKAAPLCQDYGMTFFHPRFFSVYGYGDHPWSIISTLITRLRRNEDVSLSACLHKWNFMYIDDAIEAVVRLYDHEKTAGGRALAVNVAGRDTRILREFVEEVKEIIGGSGKLEYGTFLQAKEGALSVCPDLTRLKAMTGDFRERYTFRQGIAETIKKEMEHEHEENQRIDPLL